MDAFEIDPDIVEISQKKIEENLGNVTDLPYELANTVVNIYYFYFLSKSNIHEFYAYRNVEVKFQAIDGMIHDLRKIDKTENPKEYKYLVDYILDVMKYDIKNAHKKGTLRRMIERKLKYIDTEPYGVGDLIDYMALAQEEDEFLKSILEDKPE